MVKQMYLNITFPNNSKDDILLQIFLIFFDKTSAYENK